MSWTRLQLGANIVLGTRTSKTSVTVGVLPLFAAQLSDDGRLLLSADLYADHGWHLGSFNANEWQTAQHGADLLIAPRRVTVRFRDTYSILLSVCVRDDELLVTNMDVETRDGKRCVLDASGRLVMWEPGAQPPTSHRGAVWQCGLDRIDLATLTSNVTDPAARW